VDDGIVETWPGSKYTQIIGQARQRTNGLHVPVHIGGLNTPVMDIEKQQLLLNPLRALGEFQSALNTDQRFGCHAAQRNSCWHLYRANLRKTGKNNVFSA
ncbi:MAG: hypothetical protein N2C12_08490, partial [Planctomycetales bacterium]